MTGLLFPSWSFLEEAAHQQMSEEEREGIYRSWSRVAGIKWGRSEGTERDERAQKGLERLHSSKVFALHDADPGRIWV